MKNISNNFKTPTITINEVKVIQKDSNSADQPNTNTDSTVFLTLTSTHTVTTSMSLSSSDNNYISSISAISSITTSNSMITTTVLASENLNSSDKNTDSVLTTSVTTAVSVSNTSTSSQSTISDTSTLSSLLFSSSASTTTDFKSNEISSTGTSKDLQLIITVPLAIVFAFTSIVLIWFCYKKRKFQKRRQDLSKYTDNDSYVYRNYQTKDIEMGNFHNGTDQITERTISHNTRYSSQNTDRITRSSSFKVSSDNTSFAHSSLHEDVLLKPGAEIPVNSRRINTPKSAFTKFFNRFSRVVDIRDSGHDSVPPTCSESSSVSEEPFQSKVSSPLFLRSFKLGNNAAKNASKPSAKLANLNMSTKEKLQPPERAHFKKASTSDYSRPIVKQSYSSYYNRKSNNTDHSNEPFSQSITSDSKIEPQIVEYNKKFTNVSVPVIRPVDPNNKRSNKENLYSQPSSSSSATTEKHKNSIEAGAKKYRKPLPFLPPIISTDTHSLSGFENPISPLNVNRTNHSFDYSTSYNDSTKKRTSIFSTFTDNMNEFNDIDHDKSKSLSEYRYSGMDEYIAIKKYKKVLHDELDLEVGDRVLVKITHSDGWCLIQRIDDDRAGVVPQICLKRC